ncbi:hypothetical protein BaRGS_00028528, partial [Batillaria attramentaria]
MPTHMQNCPIPAVTPRQLGHIAFNTLPGEPEMIATQSVVISLLPSGRRCNLRSESLPCLAQCGWSTANGGVYETGEVTNEISAFVLDETENVRVMQCTIDTSPHGLAGVTFHDVTGGERTRLASVELVSRKCYSGQTLASCSFDDSKSSLTLKAAVTDLRVGERRRYECTVHYGTKTEKYQVNVTVDATTTLPSTEGNTEATTTLPSTEGNTEALDTTASTSTTSRTAKRRALAATTSDPLPSARPDYVHKTDSGTVTVDGISVGIGCGVMVALLALIALFVFLCRSRRKSFE